MIYEGNSNIHEICKKDADEDYCIKSNQVVVDGQVQLLVKGKIGGFKVTDH